MDVSEASQGLGDPKLLEVIDKLVELNIGDSVNLPQVALYFSKTIEEGLKNPLAFGCWRSIKVPLQYLHAVCQLRLN